MAKDLRSFLSDLQARFPDELVRVKKPVDTKWELSAVVHRLQNEGRLPVFLFENIKGHDIPVVVNLYASRKLLACALETSPEKLVEQIIRAEEQPLQPVLVSSGPVKEVIQRGEEVDLRELPIVWHCEKDSGPFICPGVMIIKDPDTGIPNAGVYRHQLHGPRKLGVSFGPPSHAAHIFRKMEARNQDLEAVIALGHHPALGIASQFQGSLDVDELAIMGGLLGEPVEMVKCETVDLEVPAYTEIAIEGRVKANVREPDAPFGESTWYYGGRRDNQVFEVTAITRRKDAIFHDLHNVGPDHIMPMILQVEAIAYQQIKKVIPQLIAVHIPAAGVGDLIYVKIKKEIEGLAKNAALVALGSNYHLETAIVVDEDINIFNNDEVIWALMTRCDPGRDFFYVPEARVLRLNPSSHGPEGNPEEGGLKTKLGIDATRPLGRNFPERAEPPRELWQGLNLEDYLP